LIRRKGADTLMAAFARLASAHPKTELWIVGDGPEKEKLRLMVPEWLKDRVVFKGFVPFERRSEYYQDTDILVHPARHDGWGVVIQEAMASGLPVIGTKQTGAAFDLIEGGRNGFLVDADDEEMLFQRMKWFVNNPGELSTFGKRAREGVSLFTPAWGASRFFEITKEALNYSVKK
jgi:glycosyltransferase involved in cell wall biosynthesis